MMQVGRKIALLIVIDNYSVEQGATGGDKPSSIS
jgi:hypothetical protein